MKKPIAILGMVIVGLALAAAGCNAKEGTVADQQVGDTSPQQQSSSTPTPKPVTSGQQTAKTVTVSFGANGFSPATVNVAAGDKITFVNNSEDAVQPSSDPHPVHTGNTQLNSKSLAKGQSFTTGALTKTGTFGMHNHFNPSQRLTVVVK